MITRRVRARSGITLTEILISILIMGIGMISLAVLFPLGLLKLRDAARSHRSGLLAQSATDDNDVRALFAKENFTRTWYGPTFDPFTSDLPYGAYSAIVPVQTQVGAPGNVLNIPQPGLPVCYDPFWRAFTNVVPPNPNTNNALYDPSLSFSLAGTNSQVGEARFGGSIASNGTNVYSIRLSSGDTNYPSAHGLQRITNFIPANNVGLTYLYPFTYSPLSTGVVADTFVSNDDVLFNSRDNGSTGLSPLLPDLTPITTTTPVSPQYDYRYTWFFTGRQVDSTNGTMFQGDVVVCEGRQFGYIPLPAPNAAISVPQGETVVEAIFGYSENVGPTGFAVGSDKTVLLRWPVSIPDPAVRIGGWIADVTYERQAQVSFNNTVGSNNTPFQRCNWYQVNKRTDPQDDPDFPGSYRRMIVTIASPVKTKTFLLANGIPKYTNAALVMPSVINVYPRAFAQ